MMAFPVLFTDGSIIDGTGTPPLKADVLVRDGRIAEVGIPGSIPRAVGQVVNCAGATLMPGLCDAHAHITWINQANRDGLRELPLEEHTLASMQNARTYLDYGYTMVVS